MMVMQFFLGDRNSLIKSKLKEGGLFQVAGSLAKWESPNFICFIDLPSYFALVDCLMPYLRL